ncbi:MAG: type I secretion C-terminal target domain-containing protein [Hyphomicrobiaceae bacterium]|nr:type I secretion C-terminal target domain-containing protein [Hyphomicrobiaceae bacterium]
MLDLSELFTVINGGPADVDDLSDFVQVVQNANNANDADVQVDFDGGGATETPQTLATLQGFLAAGGDTVKIRFDDGSDDGTSGNVTV